MTNIFEIYLRSHIEEDPVGDDIVQIILVSEKRSSRKGDVSGFIFEGSVCLGLGG